MQTTDIDTQAGFRVTEDGILVMPVQDFEMDWEVFTNELEFE